MILLVVGCAVTCPDRSHHIARMLALEDIKECSVVNYQHYFNCLPHIDCLKNLMQCKYHTQLYNRALDR